MDNYMDYLDVIRTSLSYLFYAFVFLTLVPKSVRRILDFAETNYETNRYKYHRCYGPDKCCHSYNTDLVPKQKQRRAVTRVYPKKQNQMQSLPEAYTGDGEESNQHLRKEYSTATTLSTSKRRTTTTATSSGSYRKQYYTHTNVNKIAKMFESGGVQKKINRVTPTTILTTPMLTHSSKSSSATTAPTTIFIDNYSDESSDTFYKKNSYTLAKDTDNQDKYIKKYDKQLQKTLLTDNLKESLVNDFVQQRQLSSALTDNWCSEPIINTTKFNETYQIPISLTFAGTSITSSTSSPNQLSPHSFTSSTYSPQRLSSPTHDYYHFALDDYHYTSSLKNSQSSLEDIFAALAQNAERSDYCFYMKNNSDNPLSSPVTSIDDILSQRRLSRSLSAYSISDLLKDEITDNGIYNTVKNDNYKNVTMESII